MPGLRPDLVPRPRLALGLDEGPGRGLVLVCAPDEYGKTVLLADWVRRGRHCPAWLSLDVGDNDPARFWRHAVAAVDRARLRARGQPSELRAADLRFTPGEAAALLQQGAPDQARPAAPLTDAAVAALAARTEGWAAGLQLAALSLRGQDDVDGFVTAFSGSHRHVLDYLAEEVLEQQPGQVRAFLLETSMLEGLSGELCDTVTGRARQPGAAGTDRTGRAVRGAAG